MRHPMTILSGRYGPFGDYVKAKQLPGILNIKAEINQPVKIILQIHVYKNCMFCCWIIVSLSQVRCLI